MAKHVDLLMSSLSTALSAVSMLYLLAFIHDAQVLHGTVTTINHRPSWLADIPLPNSLLNNIFLVLVFALQHSIFARPMIRRVVVNTLLSSKDDLYPSFYAIGSSLAVFVLCIFWSPINAHIWSVEHWPRIWYTVSILNWSLWMLTFVSILSIHRFQLCGAEPLVQYLFGRVSFLRGIVKDDKKLVTTGMYGLVRHPTMFFLMLSFWVVPAMSIGHLVLSTCLSVYIVFAVKKFEEPELLQEYGRSYEQYKEKVPSQLIPGIM